MAPSRVSAAGVLKPTGDGGASVAAILFAIFLGLVCVMLVLRGLTLLFEALTTTAGKIEADGLSWSGNMIPHDSIRNAKIEERWLGAYLSRVLIVTYMADPKGGERQLRVDGFVVDIDAILSDITRWVQPAAQRMEKEDTLSAFLSRLAEEPPTPDAGVKVVGANETHDHTSSPLPDLKRLNSQGFFQESYMQPDALGACRRANHFEPEMGQKACRKTLH